MIWPFRRRQIHDLREDAGIVSRRTAAPHGHALNITRRLRVRDIVRLHDADWRIIEVHDQSPGVWWHRIVPLRERVAA